MKIRLVGGDATDGWKEAGLCVCGVIRGFIERSEETNESEEERRRRKSRERRERRCAAWLHNEILGQVKRRRRGSPSIPHRNPIPPTRRRRPTTFYFLGRKRQRNCRPLEKISNNSSRQNNKYFVMQFHQSNEQVQN